MLKRVPYKRCDKVPTLMAPGRNYVLRVRKPSHASARAVRLLGFVIRHEATQDEVDAQREDLGAVSCVPHHVENVAVEKVDVAWSVIQRAENVTNWNLIGVRLLSRSDKRHITRKQHPKLVYARRHLRDGLARWAVPLWPPALHGLSGSTAKVSQSTRHACSTKVFRFTARIGCRTSRGTAPAKILFAWNEPVEPPMASIGGPRE